MNYKEVIESRYNRQNWQLLLRDIFGSKIKFWSTPSIVATSSAFAKQALWLGTITLSDEQTIAVYEVELADSVDIERNRRGIRDMLLTTWRNNGNAGAFMFCYRKNESVLRFSYVSEAWTFADDGSYQKESTDAKRFTYLLGEGHRSRTAIQQFENLRDSSLTLKDLTLAFSVEAVSDMFFKGYKKHYEDIIHYITGKRMVKVANKWEEQKDKEPQKEFMQEFANFQNPEKAIRDYVKKLMGRLVFLQFLQKKGWLGVPAGAEWGTGDTEFVQTLFAQSQDKDHFIDNVLESLFNDLNSEDEKKLPQYRTPYLNGGLFERDATDETEFPLPAKYMQSLLDFFASYNFTIDENDPDDAEVGVDPEMLGRIFENLLEDNKDKGAFYTPKEIVSYMCRESLIAYLQTDIEDEATKEAIRQFVTTHDVNALGTNGKFREQVDEALKNVKICDPAIGSGAFPMGLLKELFQCRTALEGIEQSKAAEIKKHIIQQNIYGVDIERGAVDIARLRFWLSLIVDEETPQALPNLDFKIMQGNSLLEQYKGVDLSNITELKQDKVRTYQTTMFDDMLDVLRLDLRKKLDEYYSCTDHKLKAILKHGIVNNVKQQLKEQSFNVDLGDLDLSGNNQFMLWHTWFYDVFSQGGFDIVIGNPPYVQIKKLKEKVFYKNVGFKTYESTGDIYCLFYEMSTNLTRKGGVGVFITSNKWLKSNYGESLRYFLVKHANPQILLDLGPGVFKNAAVDTNILLWQNSTYAGSTLVGEIYDSTYLYGKELSNTELSANSLWNLRTIGFLSIKDKLENIPTTLSSIGVELDYGILTGANKTFLLNRETRDYLINLDVRNQEIIKPVLRGQDLGRYCATFNEIYLLCAHNGVKKEGIPPIDIENDYPSLVPYFESFGDAFKNRGEQGDTYYNLRNCAYIQKYENPKIIYADIVQDQGKFYYDEDKYYTNDTAFIISGDNLKYLVGVLNSKAFTFVYKNFYCGSSLGKKGLRFKRDFLLKVPIPFGNVKQIDEITALVDIIFKNKRSNHNFDSKQQEINIDFIAYQLYGLTYDEILIVDPETPITRDEYESK